MSNLLGDDYSHVAILGPAGIGKTSISSEILHHERIVAYFLNRRIFMTHDGISVSSTTHTDFIIRLAVSLGVTSFSFSLFDILSVLKRDPTLVIIDGWEVILDQNNSEARLIADLMQQLGNSPTRIVLASRSHNLPELAWLRLTAAGMDVNTSRVLFNAVYRKGIGNLLDSVFSELDFHPLSIVLLSRAAVANNLTSVEEIKQNWTTRKIHLLRGVRSQGKQSLHGSFERSIRSLTAFDPFTNSLLPLLQSVAFLPQGIREDDISVLFPTASNRYNVDAICQFSLAYRQDGFVTMISPIRMYINDEYNGSLPHDHPVLIYLRRQTHSERTELSPISVMSPWPDDNDDGVSLHLVEALRSSNTLQLNQPLTRDNTPQLNQPPTRDNTLQLSQVPASGSTDTSNNSTRSHTALVSNIKSRIPGWLYRRKQSPLVPSK